MEELVAEKVDWSRAPADTPVCEAKEVYLRDIVQAILDGYDTAPGVMEFLKLTDDDGVTEDVNAILDIFVPVINSWRFGGGCSGGCEGCTGGCGG
ncbi:MAG: (2Fe-2S)-binding protein [Synergistaceae bacterium]|nr:(2Fe-2S)-binding protein [Synergistaceae bacterium]MBQ7170493.1 (2Fe-2S)-binding protein [Synergistaceae bacterium]